VNEGAAAGRPRAGPPSWRSWCLLGAGLVAIVALAPPLGTAARRTEYAATLQFSLLAIALPALVALGAPWHRLGLAGSAGADGRPGLADRVADRRRRHRELPWALACMVAGLGVAAAWHAPGAVATVARGAWAPVVEAVTLLVGGVVLWLELVSSPPLEPRSGHLRRAVLAALAMWVYWIQAYIVGLSNRGFYQSFHHVSGGLSGGADGEIASVVLWAVATAAFIPVIFWNALTWLQSEEDPDTEVLRMFKAERRRGTAPSLVAPPKKNGASPAP
jgi:cytochrome c oxidase assembly factor CtaG